MAYLLNEVKGKGAIVSCKAHKELQRGAFLEIESFESPTAYKVKDITADTKRGNFLVNIAEPKMYDETKGEDEFTVAKDEYFRARYPEPHCVHIYDKDLVETGVAAGDYLKLGAGILAKDTAGGTADSVAIVEAVLTWQGQESVQVRYL